MQSKDARSKGGHHMKEYKVGGASGVSHYEILEDGIILRFEKNELYLYNNKKPGKKHVLNMIERAENNNGLNTYVSQHIRENYADKWSLA